MNFFVKTERELEGCTILPILVVLRSGPPKEGTHLHFCRSGSSAKNECFSTKKGSGTTKVLEEENQI
jgi:hypothetical protein